MFLYLEELKFSAAYTARRRGKGEKGSDGFALCEGVEQYIIAILGMVVKHELFRIVPGNNFPVCW